MKKYHLAAALATLVAAAPALAAGPSLTAIGMTDGFTINTFYTDNGVGASYPLLGAVAASDGSLIGSGYAYGKLLKFNEGAGNTVNGLGFGDAILTANTPGTPTGIARAGSDVYVNIIGTGIFKVNPGTLATTQLGTIQPTYGLWGTPDGNLVTSTGGGVYKVDTTSGAATLVGNASNPDGVTVSPDGSIAYAEVSGHILGYSLTSIAPNAPVFDSGFLFGGPDGTGVISGGAFNGDIIVNMNDGTLHLLTPNGLGGISGDDTIASGGERGDLVSPDANNGCLLVTNYRSASRLCIDSGTIGSDVPEPASMALLGGGLLGLGALRRRRR